MKKVYLLLFFITSITFGQTPVLTGIVDGTCSGGLPKMIEIYAQGTVDFTQFTLEKQTNGGGFTASLDLSPLGTITDDYVYLYNNGTTEADFLNEFPSATGKTLLADSFISGNGDDAFRIVDSSSNVVDIFGVENEDGSSTVWEYKDSYAKRNTGASATATFDASQWTFGGPDFLDNKGTCNGGNDFETEMGGIQTYYQATTSNTPYFTESFENGGTFPTGWTLTNGTDDWAIDQGDDHGPGSAYDGDYCAFFNDYDYSSGTTADMISPAIDLSTATAPELTFWYWDSNGSDVVEILVSTDGTNYTSLFTTPDTASDWTKYTVDLSTYAGESSVTIAFRGTSVYGYSNPHVDNIKVDEPPTCLAPSDLAVASFTTTTADLTWTDNTGGNSSYIIEWREVGSATWNSDTTAAGASTYQITGLTEKTYYEWQLTADCGGGDLSDVMPGPDFYTWYCESIPSSVDGNGITNVVIGSETYQAPGEVYHDFTADAVADLQAGEIADVQVTFETGYTYYTNIWIDLNDNLVFDDTELVYQGESTNDNPTTLDASFPMPLNAPLGNHIMRMGTADVGQGTPNPCYSGSYGATLDFTINITPAPTCPSPTNLIVDNLSFDSVDLSWTDNTSGNASYIVEWREAGSTTWNSDTTAAGAATYHLTGLNASTEYEWQVTADCGGGDTSNSVSGSNFTTACLPVDSFPYVYGFEDVTPNSGGDWSESCWYASPQNTGSGDYAGPYRWSVTDTATPSSATGPSAPYEGNNYAYTEASGSNPGDVAILYSPILDMSSLNSPTLSFYIFMRGADMGSLSVDTYDGTAWTDDVWTISGEQQTADTDDWINVEVALTNNITQIRFRSIRGSDYNSDMAIDEVSIGEPASSCSAPTDLAVANVTYNTADLSWTDNTAGAATYTVEWREAGATTWESATTATGDTSYQLTGLNDNTEYEWQLTADCGNGDTSATVTGTNFTTLVDGIDALNKYNFTFYPNPTLNNLNISADSNINSIQIVNMLGQEVLKAEINKAQYIIDTHQLNAGTYILKVNIDNNTGYYRFIKQ